jgi:hypothetical protein
VHSTIVRLKDGKDYKGPILLFRPAFNYFSIIVSDNKAGAEREFSFDECESVITPNERLTKNTIGDCDEILRAKKMLDDGRKHGWTEQGKPYPIEKFEWEKRYE